MCPPHVPCRVQRLEILRDLRKQRAFGIRPVESDDTDVIETIPSDLRAPGEQRGEAQSHTFTVCLSPSSTMSSPTQYVSQKEVAASYRPKSYVSFLPSLVVLSEYQSFVLPFVCAVTFDGAFLRLWNTRFRTFSSKCPQVYFARGHLSKFGMRSLG